MVTYTGNITKDLFPFPAPAPAPARVLPEHRRFEILVNVSARGKQTEKTRKKSSTDSKSVFFLFFFY